MMPEHRTSPVSRPRRGRQAGFTLVELVIVMVVAAILTAIAIPMYLNQIRESRRTDARSALLDAAGREERYYATNNAYTDSSINLGYTAATGNSTWPQEVGSDYYQITVNVPATTPDPNPPAAPSYSITAVPVPGSSQAADTCASLTVDSAGQQTAILTTGAADTSGTCWGTQ